MGSAVSQGYSERKPSAIGTPEERGERESSHSASSATVSRAALGSLKRSDQDKLEKERDASCINKSTSSASKEEGHSAVPLRDDTTRKVEHESSSVAALLDVSPKESSSTHVAPPAVPVAVCSPVPYDHQIGCSDREGRRGPKLMRIARSHRRGNSTSQRTPRGAWHALSTNAIEVKEDAARRACSPASPIEMAHSPTYFSPRGYQEGSFPRNNQKTAFLASFSSISASFSSPRPLHAKPFYSTKSIDNTPPLALCSASSNKETTAGIPNRYASLIHCPPHTHGGDVVPAAPVLLPTCVRNCSCCCNTCNIQHDKCPSSLDYHQQEDQHQNEHKQLNINANLVGCGASSSWCAITNSSTATAATVSQSPTDNNKDDEGRESSPSPLHPFVASVGGCGAVDGLSDTAMTPFGFSSLDSAGKMHHPPDHSCNFYCVCVLVAGSFPPGEKEGNAGCCNCDRKRGVSVSQLSNTYPHCRLLSPNATDVCSTTRVFLANTSPMNNSNTKNYAVRSCETAGQTDSHIARADKFPAPPEAFSGGQRRQMPRVLSPIRASSMSATFPQRVTTKCIRNCSPSLSPKSAVVHQCELAARKNGTLHHLLHDTYNHKHNQPRDHRRHRSNTSDGAVAGLPEFPFVGAHLLFSSFSTAAVSPKNACNSRGVEGGGSDGRGARSIILSGSRRSVRVVCNDGLGSSSSEDEEDNNPRLTQTEKEDARRALHMRKYGVEEGSISHPSSQAKIEVSATDKQLGKNTVLYAGAISLRCPRRGSDRCSFFADAFGEDVTCPLKEASVGTHHNNKNTTAASKINNKSNAAVCKNSTSNKDDEDSDDEDSSSTCSGESALVFSDDEDLSCSSLKNTTRVAPRAAGGIAARCAPQPTAETAPTLAPRRGTFLRGFDMDSAAVMSLLSSASPSPTQR